MGERNGRSGIVGYWTIILAVVAVGAIALYLLLLPLAARTLAAVVVALALLLPVLFALGYWMGRTEVRGFLHGVDVVADSFFDKLTKVVDVRDGSRERRQPGAGAQPPQQVAVILPGLDRLGQEQRRIVDGSKGDGEVIDL